ncbi:MAG: hypothetical protein ACI4SM_01910 [Candidatus Gastranaerophilaceae bacterium]
MNINSIGYNRLVNVQNVNKKPEAKTQSASYSYASKPEMINYSGHVNFTGNAPVIKKATMLNPDGKEVEMKKTENGGFIVEQKTGTELIYGNDAIKFLKHKNVFEKDTHIVFPKKATGTITIDGKTTDIKENTAIVLNKNSKAKIEVTKGYPMVMTSEKNFDWYDDYSSNAGTKPIRAKYNELRNINAHLYNGEISKSKFAPELVEKLVDRAVVTEKNGYIKFNNYYNPEFQEKRLIESGFTREEVNSMMPLYTDVLDAMKSGKLTRKVTKGQMSDEVIQRLKDENVLLNTKDKNSKELYWTKNFANVDELKGCLNPEKFSKKEIKTIVDAWNKDNKAGYDLTGLNFLADDIAMYSFDKKLNNWSLEDSCWITNSTAMATKDGKALSMGTSMVQSDIEKPVDMRKLHKSEKLHKHPSYKDKAQSEVYLVTSGCAALNIVKNGKPQVKIIKQGEVVVIKPGVVHCVNSIIGEYEQIVSQVPSAFQYGFGFKEEVDDVPYNEDNMAKIAAKKLVQAKNTIPLEERL